MNVEHTRELYDYSQWAYRQVWGCIETLTDEQFTRDSAYSHGSLRNHFVHVLNAESSWLARLTGQPAPDSLRNEDFPTREVVEAKWRQVETAWRAFLDTLDDAALEARVTYTRGNGEVKHDRRRQIIAHVVNHGTDHRAQMLALLWQMGAVTVEQDYPLYYWSIEPRTENREPRKDEN